MTSRKTSSIRSGITIAVLLSLTGCLSGGSQPNVDKSTTGCSGGSALIGIRDGQMQTICGCTEGVTQIPAGTDLVCTVNQGTLVVFDFSGNQSIHQIISDGIPSFVSSPPSIPDNGGGPDVPSHAVHLLNSGTYRFYDAFNSQQTGRIIVQ